MVWVRLRFLVNAAKFRRELYKAKAGGDPKSEDEAPPPPPPGKPKAKAKAGGGLKSEEESPPPPGRPKKSEEESPPPPPPAVLSLQETKCLRETMAPKIYQVLGSRSHGVLGFVRSAAE